MNIIPRPDMEGSRTISRGLLAVLTISIIASAALSAYLWDAAPLLLWLVMIAAAAMACGLIAAIHAVTVWPLAILIGKAFERLSKRTIRQFK